MNNNFININGLNLQIVGFNVICKVEYGQTVGVIGNVGTLGNWDEQCILPLNWTENHVWRGQMYVMPDCKTNFECKFVIFNKNQHNNINVVIDIEKGANRQYNLKNELQFLQTNNEQGQNENPKFIINEVFNKRKITFAVYSSPNSVIHVSGNIPQFKLPQQICYEQQFISESQENMSLYYQDFLIDMREDMIRYHFTKNFVSIERGVGRYMIFNNNISKPFAVQYSDYKPEVFREGLQCDNITENLSIGTFINSAHDISLLHDRGVTAIVNLQTKRDMERKFVNSHELRKICKSQGILYINAPIRDNDPFDYVKRAPEVLDIIEDLYKANHHIYIHCTAGMGRAPQSAILHLVLHRGLNINEASQLIFMNRPVASPNKEAIFTVLQTLSESSSENTSDRSMDDEDDFRQEEFTLSDEISSIAV